MRLLHCQTLSFREFYDESSFPPYAILSHTWAAGEEVTLQEMLAPGASTKTGYAKIKETCRLALQLGLEFAWVDTCCIDKSSSAELTESINSMFRWYQKAQICFAYLSDLQPSATSGKDELDQLDQCAWFTRGWTLQELIAPSDICFYNREWKCIGTRGELLAHLSRITRIPPAVMYGSPQPESSYRASIAQKMSWASSRRTTRVEDTAYCLLGLFDVQMPLIYGEGMKAFYRLQEEISKRSTDMTLFAWTPRSSWLDECSILAASPADFADSAEITPYEPYYLWPEFSFTSQGVRIHTVLWLEKLPAAKTGHGTRSTDQEQYGRYLLSVGWIRTGFTHICINVKQLGPGLFIRKRTPLFKFATAGFTLSKRSYTFNLIANVDDHAHWSCHQTALRQAMHIPEYDHIDLIDPMSVEHWDASSRLHYLAHHAEDTIAFSFVGRIGGKLFPFGVLFHCAKTAWTSWIHSECRIIDTRTSTGKSLYLLLATNPDHLMSWRTINAHLPDISQLTHDLNMVIDGMEINITASIKEQEVVHKKYPVPFNQAWLDIKVTQLSGPSRTVEGDNTQVD